MPVTYSVSQGRLVRSSTFRLALLYFGLFSTSVLGLLAFIYWSTAGYMSRQTDATINAEIQGLEERYRTDGLSGLSRLIAGRLAEQQPGDSSIYLLTDQNFRPLVGNLSRWPEPAPDEEGWLDFYLGRANADYAPHRGRAKAFLVRGQFHLLVGRDMFELEETQRTIIQTLVWGVVITLVLALLGGVTFSRGVMRRIESINRTSKEIMSGDLSRRIPTTGSSDDFDRLAGNLNDMLDQMELLMEEVKRVSDNIAHDLKTPLARLRNRLELLRNDAARDGEQLKLVDAALHEADGLLSTFNALLRIARIESKARREAFSDLDLVAVLNDVVELYEPLAEDRGQDLRLECAGALRVRGDRDLLFQCIANILDNAIKYTPTGGRISVVLDERGGYLRVCDQGPGVPEHARDKVFRRFYRLDASRSTVGSGLGLSLVAAVARLHSMEIELGDNNPGLCVTLKMPESGSARAA